MATSIISLGALDGTNGFSMSGAAAGDRAFEVSNAGDINGDGFGDILIGARYGDPGGLSNAGQGYLIFGAANGFTADIDVSALDATQGFRIDGEEVGDLLGMSVSSACDLNGDGFDDLLFGANQAEDVGRTTTESHLRFLAKLPGFALSLTLQD